MNVAEMFEIKIRFADEEEAEAYKGIFARLLWKADIESRVFEVAEVKE